MDVPTTNACGLASRSPLPRTETLLCSSKPNAAAPPAARKLLLLGWLAVCGNDPRPIVKRLCIPSARSVEVMEYFLQGSGKNGASEPGADSQTTSDQTTATTPLKASYPVSDDLAVQASEALRSRPDDEVNTSTRKAAQSFDVRQLLKMGNAQRRSKAGDT
jgi:hypothetical protein